MQPYISSLRRARIGHTSCHGINWRMCVSSCSRTKVAKAKSPREICAGLDEAGNDLGDISLGFFVRQVIVARNLEEYVPATALSPNLKLNRSGVFSAFGADTVEVKNM